MVGQKLAYILARQHFLYNYTTTVSNFNFEGFAGLASSVGCASASYADSCRFDPPVRQHSFVEISHEIISILSLPLIQAGQLIVSLMLAKGCALCTG